MYIKVFLGERVYAITNFQKFPDPKSISKFQEFRNLLEYNLFVILNIYKTFNYFINISYLLNYYTQKKRKS